MRKIITALAVALSLVLATGCAGTQQQNQESADQVFGRAKMLSFGANLTATTFSSVCAFAQKGSAVCSPANLELASAAAASMNSVILEAEIAYAKANTSDEAGKMAIAQAVMAAVNRAVADLAKYGANQAAGQGVG